MKKLLFLTSLICLTASCEQTTENKYDSGTDSEYVATIVGFDLNCSTCILQFPDDNSQIRKEIGESPNNYYQTVNMSRGDYEPGQKVLVKLRKAEADELTPCIALYPSYSYKSVYITEFEDFSSVVFNDTIELSYKKCVYEPEDQFYICLDSVLNDSRCPTGVMCIWEGNAEVKLKFEKVNENPVYFNLNTNLRFTRDTVIDGYSISLIDLSPYPEIGVKHSPTLYKASLIIKRK
jgi:hypothetical protein